MNQAVEIALNDAYFEILRTMTFDLFELLLACFIN